MMVRTVDVAKDGRCIVSQALHCVHGRPGCPNPAKHGGVSIAEVKAAQNRVCDNAQPSVTDMLNNSLDNGLGRFWQALPGSNRVAVSGDGRKLPALVNNITNAGWMRRALRPVHDRVYRIRNCIL